MATIEKGKQGQKGVPGIPVDSGGGPTVDPTANVIALNEASTKRIDDIAELREKHAPRS